MGSNYLNARDSNPKGDCLKQMKEWGSLPRRHRLLLKLPLHAASGIIGSNQVSLGALVSRSTDCTKMETKGEGRYPFRRSRRWHFVALLDFIIDRCVKQTAQNAFPNLVRNILVIRLDHIGDVVCTLPVLPILRNQFPSAKITVLVGEEGKIILKGNPYIDQVLVFRSNWFSRTGWMNPVEIYRLIMILKRERFDLGFDLRGDLRNIFLMALAGVRYRVGYGIAGGEGLLHRAPFYDHTRHQAELNLRLVTDEPIDKAALKPEIYLTPEEKRNARKRLSDLGADEDSRLIAVHPEAGYPSKEWDEDSYRQLVEHLLEDPQSTVLILGLSRAGKLAEHFAGTSRVISLVRQLSLREMIAVLGECDLLIGNDSGPSHMARALGVPVVVIASGTNEYEKWGVWTEPSKILRHTVPCSPCHLRYCNVEGHPCMSHISPAQVLKAVRELLVGVT